MRRRSRTECPPLRGSRSNPDRTWRASAWEGWRCSRASLDRGRCGFGDVNGNLNDAEVRLIWLGAGHQRHRDVVDGNEILGAPLGTATMRVTVKHHRHGEPADRILEAARTDERVDLGRLALDCLLNRRVVK